MPQLLLLPSWELKHVCFPASRNICWGFCRVPFTSLASLLLSMRFACHHQEGSGQRQWWQFNDCVDKMAQRSWEILLCGENTESTSIPRGGICALLIPKASLQRKIKGKFRLELSKGYYKQKRLWGAKKMNIWNFLKEASVRSVYHVLWIIWQIALGL